MSHQSSPSPGATRSAGSRTRARARAKRRRMRRRWLVVGGLVVLCLVLLLWRSASRTQAEAGGSISQHTISRLSALIQGKQAVTPLLEEDWVDQELLPENPYSRPGTALTQVNGIVVHYVDNPGTTAMQNRNYFAGLADTHETSASSHFIVGLKGEVIQCIPTDEIAYCSNDRNSDTISIECCHPSADGSFNQATYDSLIRLLRTLCQEYGLTQEDIIRHYDITGKNCPLYYVEHEDAWAQLKTDVFDPDYPLPDPD